MVLSRQHVRSRVRMVEVDHDPVLVQDRLTDLTQRLDCERRGIIVAHYVVHVQQQNLPCLHGFPSFTGKDFFDQSTHSNSPYENILLKPPSPAARTPPRANLCCSRYISSAPCVSPCA